MRKKNKATVGRPVLEDQEGVRVRQKGRGKAAANTGPSTNSEGRVNGLAEGTDEPARGSGSLQTN
ncbi:hypothetical protein T4B_14102 [Trichinella pseudospiralis]|uniref:Uncharacterized protein n=1 Tax=Trichinella pseudospiralis TaxID=6337 RepID=A0A0V0YFE4_TRIPS|nr:hypothetical protein T4E_5242 [Trichinella pseudospiralis]KRY79182.1 hypothetical protein T4A_471 [Trichinella pseudospiralis]KRZ32438.1 hypothetical protein T4B_14102 [Trichinella pseudospiralis]KRZ45552.1 hypothetical protein T4C_10438 [Trichinella pseudospiralis]